MSTTDPIAVAARAAAQRIAANYRPGLVADVEAALYARTTAQRSNPYLDPVSLGSLIVSITTLAWTIYADLRKKTTEPRPEEVARQVRIELHDESTASQHETDHITEIIVTEIIQAARDLR